MDRLARFLTLRTLTVMSAVHSTLFTVLMVLAVGFSGPQPATFIFGLSHGIMFPLMGVAVGIAARAGTVSWTTALVVMLVGAVAPHFGTWDFIREGRRRAAEGAARNGT
ncbi:MAG: hypothetical protein U0Y82_05600 [Thermoleophilia bacterium]